MNYKLDIQLNLQREYAVIKSQISAYHSKKDTTQIKLNKAIHEKRPYVEFTLHSSELMPGGSPTFPHKKDVEQLYRDLETIFRKASKHFVGSTLYEFYQKVLYFW